MQSWVYPTCAVLLSLIVYQMSHIIARYDITQMMYVDGTFVLLLVQMKCDVLIAAMP